ncbi:MAG TPA: transcriptional repressor [Gammaproteobacteria bacterium]|nr:transcriptional repressor [Gammaproteobacteria bacterium]
MLELISKSETIKILRRYQISPTTQRIEIAQILLSKNQHLSADQVLEAVNHERSKVSKATVYNTLGLFSRKGLVRELVIDSSKVFYDSNAREHHHFFNVETGELQDIEHEDFDFGHLPHLPEGTIADGIDVIIRVKGVQ